MVRQLLGLVLGWNVAYSWWYPELQSMQQLEGNARIHLHQLGSVLSQLASRMCYFAPEDCLQC